MGTRLLRIVVTLLLASSAVAADKFAGGIKADAADVTTFAIVRSSSTGSGLTGKVFSDFVCSYWRQGGTVTAITEATLAGEDAAHADGGIVEVDATAMPGVYRVDWPDAAFAAASDWVVLACTTSGAYEWVSGYALETTGSSEVYARIGAAGAGLTDLATQASVNTIDDFVDTEVAAILALLDDARTEPGQGTPPVNPDLATKIDFLYKAWRNRKDQTATLFQLYADDATTVDQKATVSDSGGTTTMEEVTAGP